MFVYLTLYTAGSLQVDLGSASGFMDFLPK